MFVICPYLLNYEIKYANTHILEHIDMGYLTRQGE